MAGVWLEKNYFWLVLRIGLLPAENNKVHLLK